MKKNIKLTDKHTDLLQKNIANFKNEILVQAANSMVFEGGSVAPGFSKAFVQAGWEKSF